MPRGPLNILIVDDNEDDREIIARILRGAGVSCNIAEAVSVSGALAACQERSFDCVILDYQLPGEDGLKGLERLHELQPHLVVLIATGHGDEMLAAEAVTAGAMDYIPKGRINQNSLRRAVDNAIEKGSLKRKVAEQQEALASFNQVLAHDLKAPLSAVTGFAALLRNSLSEGDAKNGAVYCARIENAAKRMSTLIDTLRAYTRPDVKVTFEPVSMTQVMDDALANLHQIIEESHARITSRDLPVVTGNSPLLTNLLQNLISNSIKFCKADTPSVDIAAALQEGGRWLFAVKDNGIGIPQEAAKPIFEPFTRIPGREDYPGTGLGLATCRKIVERHKGAIWCESGVGQGTTMYFTLPAAERRTAA
jgi:signal transduction histidine kinase